MLAENNPLVVDYSKDLQYQLWGLSKPLPKTAVIINEIYGEKVADITSSNMANFWSTASNEENFSITLNLSGKLSNRFIGWAISDENGILYLARNSNANENQVLYFNPLHRYHEQV